MTLCPWFWALAVLSDCILWQSVKRVGHPKTNQATFHINHQQTELMEQQMKIFDLSERVVIITGASSGLGKTFARGLCEIGAKVVLAARRIDRLVELVDEIESSGGNALAVQCDVTQSKEVDAMVNTTLDHFGGLDVLVNNAGMVNVKPIEEESEEEFRQVMDVNITGLFLCAQRCGQEMLKAGKGSIINIASIMGQVGIGLVPQSSYAASKGAVVNFTREVAAQWARRGIRVNAIAPGWFPTEMTDDMLSDENGSKFIRRNTPMGRPGQPEELMGALILLASDASSYMTGQIIKVDGGWTII